jgi:hypothetical protein
MYLLHIEVLNSVMWHVVILKIQERLLRSEESKKSEMGNIKKVPVRTESGSLIFCAHFFFSPSPLIQQVPYTFFKT